jgi:hypothetical protein
MAYLKMAQLDYFWRGKVQDAQEALENIRELSQTHSVCSKYYDTLLHGRVLIDAGAQAPGIKKIQKAARELIVDYEGEPERSQALGE